MSLLERVIEGRVSLKGRVASSIDQSGMSMFLQPENFVVPVGLSALGFWLWERLVVPAMLLVSY